MGRPYTAIGMTQAQKALLAAAQGDGGDHDQE
jgi:hypothetical protein